MTSEERSLVALAHISIAARGHMMSVDEPLTLALMKVRQPVIDSAALRHQGYQLESGRGLVILEFASAVSALRAAIEIQREMNQRNAAGNQLQSVRLQIGIELVDMPDTGQGLEKVARMHLQSPIGGIALSDSVFQVAHSHIETRILSLGLVGLEPGRGLVPVWQVDLGEGTTIEHAASEAPVDETGGSRTPLRPSGSFFANAMQGTSRAGTGGSQAGSSEASFEIESHASGKWTLVEVMTDITAARDAAKDRARDEKSRVRLMEVVWLADGRSQSKPVAEFNGAPDGARAKTYEIESNGSGAWMVVGTYDSRDEAMAEGRGEASDGQCRVKVLETSYNQESHTYSSKLVIEFNGTPSNANQKYVPTDTAGRRRF